MKVRLFKDWLEDEAGAVTVDWVIMTAFVVSLGFVVADILGGTTLDHAGRASDSMVSQGIATYGGAATN